MSVHGHPIVLPLPGNERLADGLAERLPAERGSAVVRRFPDGESYVRLEQSVRGRDVILACTLHHPDDKLAPLLFTAATARDLGAASVGLVAPYLGYMRQDRRFHEGEGVTSVYFAGLLSRAFDWLVTVDPHLHRTGALSDIYRVPSLALHAAPRLSDWIRENVSRPLLIGPDAESAQWVGAVARGADAPMVVLEKVRKGDRDVLVSPPTVDQWPDHTPVLVDDIISTAHTMIEPARQLRGSGLAAPVCVAVHAVFAEGAHEELLGAGVARIVTTDTIPHPTNRIELAELIGDGVRSLLAGLGG